jgi:predicted transposase YbfD/YdcC
MLALEGAIVTAAALNCQRAVAAQIVERKGDYALALKGNQGTLLEDAALLLEDAESKAKTSQPPVDGDHGHVETRTATVSAEIGWLRRQRPGLKAVGKMVRVRETADNTTTETARYLLSRALSPERLNQVAQQHWSLENSLHWRLDAVMNEDRDRTRMGRGPHNLAVPRHMAINAMQKRDPKAPCAENSNAPAGTTPSSSAYWSCFEMRLPCPAVNALRFGSSLASIRAINLARRHRAVGLRESADMLQYPSMDVMARQQF